MSPRCGSALPVPSRPKEMQLGNGQEPSDVVAHWPARDLSRCAPNPSRPPTPPGPRVWPHARAIAGKIQSDLPTTRPKPRAPSPRPPPPRSGA